MKGTTMTLKAIDSNIALVRTTGDAFNNLVQETGIMILEHAQKHGDCTRALTLVKAMPASIRRTILVAWFSKYSPIRVVEKNDKVGLLKEGTKNYTPFDIEGAKAEPWHALAEATPEEKVYTFEMLLEMAARLGKTIQKKVDDGKVEVSDIPSVDALVHALNGLKVERVKAITIENNAGTDQNNDQQIPEALRAVA